MTKWVLDPSTKVDSANGRLAITKLDVEFFGFWEWNDLLHIQQQSVIHSVRRHARTTNIESEYVVQP